jgi:thymidylate kinase
MKKLNDGTRKGSVGSAADSPTAKEKPVNRLSHPTVPAQVKKLLDLRRQRDKGHQHGSVVVDARVLIVEGIAGSGKDTFQSYLRQNLKGRDVYDYSEGELLHSWKHFPIDGILKLRMDFLKLFVEYIRDMLRRNERAVFLLNRFHLSTYVTTVARQPELEAEYDEVIAALKALPVHVFILELNEQEIERRSAHPERSQPYRDLQQQMVAKDGFRDRLQRYRWQQKLMLQAAKKQQIPYSIVGPAETTKNWQTFVSPARRNDGRLSIPLGHRIKD